MHVVCYLIVCKDNIELSKQQVPSFLMSSDNLWFDRTFIYMLIYLQTCHSVTQYIEIIEQEDKKERVIV